MSDITLYKKTVAAALLLASATAAIGFFVGRRSNARLNRMINLDKKKVTDVIDLEEIGDRKAFCRCWKSKTFPYCDGAHKQHNLETGDNIGAVVVKRKDLYALSR